MEETMDEIMERMKADQARFYRRMARQRRIALWSLIPYLLAGLAVGYGISRAFACDRLTFGLLAGGFIVMMSLQWVTPVVTERVSRKVE